MTDENDPKWNPAVQIANDLFGELTKATDFGDFHRLVHNAVLTSFRVAMGQDCLPTLEGRKLSDFPPKMQHAVKAMFEMIGGLVLNASHRAHVQAGESAPYAVYRSHFLDLMTENLRVFVKMCDPDTSLTEKLKIKDNWEATVGTTLGRSRQAFH